MEVLSPSTESIDLREKLAACQEIASLRADVVVWPDQRRGLTHSRAEENRWYHALYGGDAAVPFPCREVKLTLDEIYDGLDLSTPILDAALRSPLAAEARTGDWTPHCARCWPPKRALVTGRRPAFAAGRRSALATWRCIALVAGCRTALATGRRALVTGW